MKDDRGGICWYKLLGENGWQWDSGKSMIDGDEYGFYGAQINGCSYNVGCWARVSDGPNGYSASGDYGVVWIECDLSTYTIREYFTTYDALEIEFAVDHAETNLLKCGIPFTDGYRFHGKNAHNKARRNASLRKKLCLKSKEEERHGCENAD